MVTSSPEPDGRAMTRLVPILLLTAAALTGCRTAAAVVNTAAGVAGSALQAKLVLRCVPEGVAVDTPDGRRPIEALRAGDLVIGYGGKPVTVLQKHEYLESPDAVFVTLRFDSGAKVCVCDRHRVAGKPAAEWKAGESIGRNKIASVEVARIRPMRSYDLLTQDQGYRIQGIPTNSMIEEMQATMREFASR